MPARETSAARSLTDINERRWLSQAQTCVYWGVTDRTLRNYVRAGRIKAHRLPGSRLIRFDRLELDAAMRPIPSAKVG